MKSLRFLPLLLLLSVFQVSAQDTSQAVSPDVSVVKQNWSFYVRNPALDEDPFRAIDETNINEKNRIENIRQNDIRAKLGRPKELPPARVNSSEREFSDKTSSYIYSAKFKNTGQKTVQSIAWEYVFLNPETGEENGRIAFENENIIKPGDTKNILNHSASPPSGTINANQAGKNKREQYLEKVFIKKIIYTDGTIWTAST